MDVLTWPPAGKQGPGHPLPDPCLHHALRFALRWQGQHSGLFSARLMRKWFAGLTMPDVIRVTRRIVDEHARHVGAAL